MAKNKISEWSTTASNNTDVGGINIAEGCAPSGINNAIRELMAQVKDMQTGVDGDGLVVGGTFTASGGAVLSGTVTAPTPSAGDNSTKVATTAFIASALGAAYPIGSIYINASVSTNPATLLGFGTWVAFGAGRVMAGFDSSDSLFNSAEKTGGSKDAVVVSHTHSITDPGHRHLDGVGAQAGYNDGYGNNGNQGTGWRIANTQGTGVDAYTNSVTTGISINSTGSSATNANVQPYITVYMWKRTA
jgi:hypothetical protein